MTPARKAHIERVVTFLSRNEHRGRTVPPIQANGPWDGRACVAADADGWTEYAQHDPDEYPYLVFRDPPDTRDVPLEKYPPEPDPFDRDEYWWRRK